MNKKTQEHIQKLKQGLLLSAALSGSGLTASAAENAPAEAAPAAIEAEAAMPEQNLETSINYNDAAEQFNRRVDTRDERLNDFCEQNNIVRLTRAAPELERKLDHNRFSGIYQAYKDEVYYRYGQAYTRTVPAEVICLPHNPHENLHVYESYRNARESSEHGIGAFEQTGRRHSRNGYRPSRGAEAVDGVINTVNGISELIHSIKGRGRR